MRRCALLTCDDLSAYVSDEDVLSVAISEQCGIKTDWLSWSSPTDWSKYNYAIIRTTWDYTEKRDLFLQTLEQMVAQGVLLFNSLSTVKWNSHKSYLFDLRERGVPVVDSFPLAGLSAEGLYKFSCQWPQKQILLKPLVGATSQGLQLFDNNLKGTGELLQEVHGEKEEWFVQPFHEEIRHGEVSLIYFNKKFSHALKKVPKPGDFRSQEEFGSEILSYTPNQQEQKFGEMVLNKAPEELLYARVDYILVNNQPKLMELELVEPALYFRTHSQALDNFVSAIKNHLRSE